VVGDLLVGVPAYFRGAEQAFHLVEAFVGQVNAWLSHCIGF
jgi:hypothetical protein